MPIELPSGHRFIADALVVDGRADVALMKVRDLKWASANGYKNDYDLHPVKVGKSSDVTQGTRVLAVGAPLMQAYMFNMTSGIIGKTKAYNPLSILPTFLIDAQINPGNSGGLLAREDTGEWIGMNSSGLFGAGGGNRGLNHAIRSEEIIFWIRRMVTYKKVVRDGITGMTFMPVIPPVREKLGLKTKNGAFIAGVEQDDPPVDGKLQRTDVINCIRIKKPDGSLYREVDVRGVEDAIFAFQMAANLDVEVDLFRGGVNTTVSFNVPLELMPFSNQASFDPYGMEIQTYRTNKGVQVTNIHPQCPLYPYIDRYDVITGVEDPSDPSKIVPVTDYDAFYKLATAHGDKLFWVETKDDDILFSLERVKAGGSQHINAFGGVEFEDDLIPDGDDDEGGYGYIPPNWGYDEDT